MGYRVNIEDHDSPAPGAPPVPWFRVAEVWLIIGVLVAAVVVGLSFAALSIYSWDGLVVDDYYRHGKEINKVLVRDQAAKELGLTAVLGVPAENSDSVIRIGADDANTQHIAYPDEPITLRLLHPTRSGEDQSIALYAGPVAGSAREFYGRWSPVRPGDWIVHVESPRWRLTGRARFPLVERLVLGSATDTQ
jgi:hypothetical protein